MEAPLSVGTPPSFLNATNLSVNGTFDTRIDNTSGTIHGNASMIFNTASALTSTGDQFYQLINADGGTIGGSATLDVTTKNLSSGRSLFAAILNSTNDGGATGTVASNASLISTSPAPHRRHRCDLSNQWQRLGGQLDDQF